MAAVELFQDRSFELVELNLGLDIALLVSRVICDRWS